MKNSISRSLHLAMVNTLCMLHNLIGATSFSLSDPFRWIDEEFKLIEVSQKYVDSHDERLNKLKK